MSQVDAYTDRALALAAVLQSVGLVQQIADTGQVNQDELSTLLQSLIAIEAENTAAVYGGVAKLQNGLRQLNQQLSKKKTPQDIILIRYSITLVHLERKLAKRPDMLATIRKEIEQLPQHLAYFDDITSPQVIARFAGIYERTISELSPRIQVLGEASHLQQPDNVNKVRALLLCGIRAAVLWRQKGGNRWQLMFASNKLLKASTALLQSL
ncbi:uncharacterized protein involved in purine metabolism [Methylophaga frappieri]|uniref:High frequency lysogenization protein HflD homolog n=1 Tax=Methylophaga frappieri (strain ATCC BAA-2434 / DSM 25690 / JAM7) TaxID=754477 RepID=I1YEE5_METFJ|nr:high frequency lysogenization protein HflD [Methylophaga frappieri]AFJ01288.1 uncharacterized protein involved in purine metabolism [Methylophaga frappieri]